MSDWVPFSKVRPEIGDAIEVRWLDDAPSLFTEPTFQWKSLIAGKVFRITDEGGPYLYIDCVNAVGAAVRCSYEWRKTK